MQKNSYSFSEFGFSSQIIRDLVTNNTKINSFIESSFSLESFKSQIETKQLSFDNRLVLNGALLNQNHAVNLTQTTQKNIEALKNENSFTITTGHQLNFLTGPLYSIYKILQVIIWAEKLNKTYPENKFIPTFWMASEDHDFEEINHINLFNSKFKIEAENQSNFIAGKITATNFDAIETELLAKFSDENLKAKIKSYLMKYNNRNLAEATRELLNELFGEFGLVIIDGDDKKLKQLFLPTIKRELEESVTFKNVTQSNLELDESGYHNQVFLRDCNLFYIENETTRYRIIKTDNGFEINGNQFLKTELIGIANQFPERFSPNALMRPLYQETILPNLVYFGGGGEIAYWLQLKSLFNDLELPFPLLRVRDSYLLLPEKQIELLNELAYSVLDLKQNVDDLTKAFVKENSTSDISMNEELDLFNKLKVKLISKVESKDVGIQRFIEGELVKIENQLDKVEKKLIQNEKKSLEKSIKQIQRLKDKIYPKNGFQERFENFLQYVNNENFISDLKKETENNLTVEPKIQIITL
jgi:bacillithiol biosynthesis cysteine-adding enzyme BshC